MESVNNILENAEETDWSNYFLLLNTLFPHLRKLNGDL